MSTDHSRTGRLTAEPGLRSLIRRAGLTALAFLTVVVPSSRDINLPNDTAIDWDREFSHGSRVEIVALTPTQIENLVVLAKVWGFLKYHHSRVTSGFVQWDFELFRVLPSILDANDASERNMVLVDWVNSLGSIPACWRCASPPSNVHLAPRIDWIWDEALLGQELSTLLQHVWETRPTDEQFWVGFVQVEGTGKFAADLSREPWYAELEDVDAGYRILAAFRFWNIVEYWFPYRDLIEENWDDVLRDSLPIFVDARSHADYQRALLQLAARVHDTHAQSAQLSSRPPVGDCEVLNKLRFVSGEAVVTDVRRSSEFVVGDVLLEIDGTAVQDLLAEVRPYYAASNEAAQLQDIAPNLTRGDCGAVAVVVDRRGKSVHLEVDRVSTAPQFTRTYEHDRPGDAFQMLGSHVAYLKLSAVSLDDLQGYVEDAIGTLGLIIDIRAYPRSNVMWDLPAHLVEVPTPFFKMTHPELANPGAFTWSDPIQLYPKPPHYEGKVVILVDEAAVSSAEFTAMACRAAPNSVVVGSTTAGADGNVVHFKLPGREMMQVSGLGVFYPDGRPTQRIGIVPDIEVHPTRAGIIDGRDEVLERAMREILGSEVTEAEIRELLQPEQGPSQP